MFNANGNFDLLKNNYLFATIGEKTAEYLEQNPDADIIKLGIGDCTRPLPKAITDAMHEAVDEMGREETFEGYPPNTGFSFLKKAIIENDYKPLGVDLEEDELFISDGAKSDTANFTDLFGTGNIIALTDPVYPVYRDSNVFAGNAGKVSPDGQFSKLRFLPCKAEDNFAPQLPFRKVDIIYLCSPNNPTGTAMTRDELETWVRYALKHGSLILFDGAYEHFVTTEGVPRSIYEIDGAKECAVEFRSFSKTAGFTGVRCAYTIVPKNLKVHMKEGGTMSLNRMWNRRHATKFNGVSYIIQKGALACYSDEGKKQIDENIEYYRRNAQAIRDCFKSMGYDVYGGVDSPYVWLKTPGVMNSWQFFDHLLNDFQIVGTPGSGFGNYGEGYFRLTGFGSYERTNEAIDRLKNR
jgi:LL-diaminopimelate aminotransferase